MDQWNGALQTCDVLEPGAEQTYYDEFERNVRDLIQQGRVRPLRSEALAAVLHFDQVDMVFLDDDHAYEHVRDEIRAYRQVVRPGGILCGHDYMENHPGVMQAVDEAFGCGVQRAGFSIWWVRL